MGWSGVVGTGLVVGRRDSGWSSPSAISLVGVGWGFQLGGAVSDILIVLQNRCSHPLVLPSAGHSLPGPIIQARVYAQCFKPAAAESTAPWQPEADCSRMLRSCLCVCRQALQAFCGRVHVGGGLGASLAIGPMGRQAEAALHLGVQGGALCYSYSLSAGVFAGKSSQQHRPSSTRTAAHMSSDLDREPPTYSDKLQFPHTLQFLCARESLASKALIDLGDSSGGGLLQAYL